MITIDKNEWNKVKHSVRHVFARPALLLISLAWGTLALGIVLWLPNIEIIKVALDNRGMSAFEKVRFMFEIYQILFRVLGLVQIVIMLLFALLSAILAGLFTYVAYKQHNNTIPREDARPALVIGVLGSGLAMLGITLLTPVITISGVVFGFTLHATGTLISMGGLGLMAWASLLHARLIHKLHI